MRRSNRSIEVFDISLMAVVTKAMGAFLVIMLLLMPYYKSGPVGEKTAAELAKELNQAQEELKKAIDNMKKSDIDPQELERIKRLLEETQRRLQMAQTLADRLKRENDQLNSQVSRLESELQESKQKLAKEEQKNKLLENKLAKLSNPQLNVHLSNSDCHDVVMDVALWNRTRNQIRFVNDTPPINYTFNYASPGYGYMSRNVLSREVITAFRASVVPTPQVVILIVRDKNLQKINGENGYLLRKTSKACNITITRESFFPESSDYYPWGTIDMKIAPSTYAQVLWEAKLVKDKISLSEPTAEDKAWVQEQIAKAKKAPEVKPPPKESKPISKQDALAAIEKLPVPRSVDECKQLIGRTGAILSQARVRLPNANSGVNIQLACTNRRFAEAQKALQAVARAAIAGKNNQDNKGQPQKPLSMQEALAQIEKFPVPHSVSECADLARQVGSILSRSGSKFPGGNWIENIQRACFSNQFDVARTRAQALAREAIAGKKSEDNKQQPPKPLSKQEALAQIEKLPVPRSVGECIQLTNRVGLILSQSRTKMSNGNWVGNIHQACFTNRFNDARKSAQALAREAITGNKNIENSKQQPPKNGTVKLTKQDALALIDRAPIPTNPQTCMMTAMRAMRMLVEFQVMNPQSENTMQAVRKDCAEGRFADALKKTKDEVHRVLK
jgi:hypothetical protein